MQTQKIQTANTIKQDQGTGLPQDFSQQFSDYGLEASQTKTYNNANQLKFESENSCNTNYYQSEEAKPQGLWGQIKHFFAEYSKVVFSRESTYRGFVDIFANDLPSLIAAATRNKYNFLEELMKSITSTAAIFLAPQATKISAQLVGSTIFSGAERQNIKYYLLFARTDLDDLESFDKARHEVARRESQDRLNLASLFGHGTKQGKAYLKEAKEIQDFFINLKVNDQLLTKVRKLKKASIVGQNVLESGFWGFFPFSVRLFRKYVLGVDRFTGTMAYLGNKENDKLGNQKGFSAMQLAGTLFAMLCSPVLNLIGLNLSENKERVAKSPFLQSYKELIDMSHGIYPKLALFSLFGQIPIVISKVFNAQGRFELFESVFKFIITSTSFLLGDRVTNGGFAKVADRELQKEFGTEPGILYHHQKAAPGKQLGWWQRLKQRFPEAQKFQEVLDKVSHNKLLQNKAVKKYINALYKGFSFHALGMFAIKMAINQITRMNVARVTKK